MMYRKQTPVTLVFILNCFFVCAQDNAGGLDFNAHEPENIRDARMEWFRDAHFGMFVHWGLYSAAAGAWDGKEYPGCAEWIQNAANVPADVYAKTLIPLFKPKKDFAREW